MKTILLKYLNTKEEFKQVAKEILESNLDVKSSFSYALAKTEGDIVVEKLDNIINVGLSDSIKNLKESATYHKPNIKMILEEMAMNSQTVEDTKYMATYLNILKENEYDPTFNKELKEITSTLDESKRTMALCHYYLNLVNENTLNKVVKEAREILFEMIVDDSEINESRFLNIAKTAHNVNVRNAAEYLIREKANLSKSQNDFNVTNVYGLFEHINENEFVIHTEKRNLLYNDEKGIVEDAKDIEVSNEFMSLSKLMDSGLVSVSETIDIKANKLVSISDENKKVYVKGKEVKVLEGSNLPYTLVSVHGINKQYLPSIQYVLEHSDKFASFDMGKKIESKSNPNLNAVVFKLKNNIFSFKNNNKIATKYITESFTAEELRQDILEFINFDIKEGLSEMFELELIKEGKNEQRKKEILSQISKLESELEKIENVETEEDLEDDESVQELKKVIKKSINELRKEYTSVDEKNNEDEGYVEVSINGKKDEIFYVNALEYTQAAKSDQLTVKDGSGKSFTEAKKNIKPIE
jgi:hypothetical protein